MYGKAAGFLRDLWVLVKPYWSSEERWAARGLLAAIVGLNLGLVYINVLINEWNNDFYNALQDLDYDAFWRLIIRFSVLAAVFIAVAVYRLYLNQMLQIRWRRWLTERYIQEWLAGQTYYRLHFNGAATDNPDQRIAEDLNIFVSSTLSLSLGLLSAVVTLVSFLGILWGLSGPLSVWGIEIPGYMVWVAIVYAFVGSWLTHVIGRALARLNFQQQRCEADFRFALVRFRENAEGIALYGGEADEARNFGERFTALMTNFWSIMRCQKRLTWFTAGYGQVAVIFPYVVVAPRYFSKEIALGGLMQTASAFRQVQDALSWFIDAYASLAEWRATVDRLTGFHNAIRAVCAASALTPQIVRGRGDGKVLEIDGLTLALPHRAAPLVSATLTVSPGESVLVSGPSGSGKSTLFRAIAGIWPFGSGEIRLPAEGRTLFLPQKPYLPIGSLKAALCYPAAAGDFDDETVVAAMRDCDLARFVDALHETDHWALRLSPGEQQRVAFARVLLHRPDWLFLDEATSALDPATEERMYRLVRARLPEATVVSVGHRTALAAFHQRRIVVQHDGTGVGRMVEAAV